MFNILHSLFFTQIENYSQILISFKYWYTIIIDISDEQTKRSEQKTTGDLLHGQVDPISVFVMIIWCFKHICWVGLHPCVFYLMGCLEKVWWHGHKKNKVQGGFSEKYLCQPVNQHVQTRKPSTWECCFF